ncbi:MAG TPA: hypothetical protein VK630_04135 [Reyranella sp.]|nr:hypothetical protein [Reyranella sp.]
MTRWLALFLLLLAGGAQAQDNLFSPTATASEIQFVQNGAALIPDLSVLIGTRIMGWAVPPCPGCGSSFYIPCCRDPLSKTSPAISSISWSNGTVTVVTATAHGLTTGRVASVIGSVPPAYNGTFTATVINTTTFTYPLPDNPGANTTPGVTSIATAANPHDLKWFYDHQPDWLVYAGTAISSISWSDGTVTVVTATAHGLTTAMVIGISGNAPDGFNGTFTATVINTTTFTYPLPDNPGVSTVLGLAAKGTASTGGSGNLEGIDIGNEAVREYMLQYVKDPTRVGGLSTPGVRGVLNGFQYVGVDNIATSNGNNIVGRYAGAVPGCPSGRPACGGTWTPRYSGNDDDPAWSAEMISWALYLRAHLHAIGVRTWLNAKLIKYDISESVELCMAGDACLRESMFLRACTAGTTNTEFVEGLTSTEDWYAALKYAGRLWDKQNVQIFNYLCRRSAAEAQPPEILYALANYYLVRGEYTYFEMQNGTGVGTRDAGVYVPYPAPFHVSLGTWLEPPPTAGEPNSGGGCYQRRFQYGMVVVWPSATGSCTFTVPSDGFAYKDPFGTAVSAGVKTLASDNSVTPPRGSAVVLYRDP